MKTEQASAWGMRVWLAVLAVMLAGCAEGEGPEAAGEEGSGQDPVLSEPAEGQDEAPEPTDPPSGQTNGTSGTANATPAPQRHEQSYDLLVNPDLERIAIGGVSRNCVFFWDTDGAAYRILEGTAELTWEATPNTPAFILRIIGADDDTMASGGSPLEITYADLAPDGWGAGFWVDYSVLEGTIPVAQMATLSVSFTYEGVLPEASIGTCAGGEI